MLSADTICVYGDSHIGSVKFALDGGLLPELEGRLHFWGAPGPEFRALRMKRGRITPDAKIAETVARVRGDGPERLGPKDFDTYIFYGSRLRIGEFLKAAYDHETTYGPVTDAALRASVRDWMLSVRAFRHACSFGKAGARIVHVPTSLPLEGVVNADREARLYHVPRSAPVVARVLEAVADVGRANFVPIVFQPAEATTDLMMTPARFAPRTAIEGQDVVHKSAAFAALMIREALAHLELRFEEAKVSVS